MAAGETTPLLAPDPESLSLKDDEGVSARASVEDFASFLSLDLFSDLLEHQRPQPDVLSSNQKALVSHLGSGSSIDVNTSDLPEHDLAASGGALLYLLLKTKPSKRQQSKMTSSQQIAHSARCQNRQGVLSEAFQRWVDLVAAKESGCMTQNGTPCEDLLASLLHHPFSLEGQTSCLTDILLKTVALPKTAAIRGITCHPALVAATSRSWQCCSTNNMNLFLVYRIWWWIYVFTTIFIALSPASGYWYHLNPLFERRCSTEHHMFRSIVWWLWLPTAVGWSAELIRALTLGPLPLTRLKSLPLPAGSYTALIAHACVLGFVVLRLVAFGHQAVASLAYILLAWSVPFHLFSLFVLPCGLPSLAPAVHSPAPARFKALRVLNDRIQAYSPFTIFFVMSAAFLVWSLNGEVDLGDPSKPGMPWPPMKDGKQRTVSPIEVRSSLAAGVLFAALVMWLVGDAIASTTSPEERAADIAEHVQLEQMRTVRLFTPAQTEVPPVPPPFNLIILLPRVAAWVLAIFNSTGAADNNKGTSWRLGRVIRRVRIASQTMAWAILWPQMWVTDRVMRLLTR